MRPWASQSGTHANNINFYCAYFAHSASGALAAIIVIIIARPCTFIVSPCYIAAPHFIIRRRGVGWRAARGVRLRPDWCAKGHTQMRHVDKTGAENAAELAQKFCSHVTASWWLGNKQRYTVCHMEGRGFWLKEIKQKITPALTRISSGLYGQPQDIDRWKSSGISGWNGYFDMDLWFCTTDFNPLTNSKGWFPSKII